PPGAFDFQATPSGLHRADRLGQLRQDLVRVSDDAVVRDLEDRCVRILVDRDDGACTAHTGKVLHRAGDADGDVELWRYRLAGLSHLFGVRTPAGIDDSARSAERRLRAECVTQLLEQVPRLRSLHAATTAHDDCGLANVRPVAGCRLDLAHLDACLRRVECGGDRLDRAGLRVLCRTEDIWPDR